jgi:hypothetical protein
MRREFFLRESGSHSGFRLRNFAAFSLFAGFMLAMIYFANSR